MQILAWYFYKSYWWKILASSCDSQWMICCVIYKMFFFLVITKMMHANVYLQREVNDVINVIESIKKKYYKMKNFFKFIGKRCKSQKHCIPSPVSGYCAFWHCVSWKSIYIIVLWKYPLPIPSYIGQYIPYLAKLFTLYIRISHAILLLCSRHCCK